MKKIALITGANRGIGLETAIQLGKHDVKILAAARTLDKANEAVNILAKENIEAQPIQLDVTNEEDINNAVKTIGDEYGYLDILINNAGIIQGEEFFGNSTLNIKPQDLKETFDTNFFSVVNVTQKLLPLIQKSEAGRIVNLSSILGSLSLHADEQSPIKDSKPFAYDASKTALNQFTVHLANALRDTNVKVNSAHPGWVKTDMGGAAAPMHIEDGAKTSVQLALLGSDGPSGKYIHLGDELPW